MIRRQQKQTKVWQKFIPGTCFSICLVLLPQFHINTSKTAAALRPEEG